MKTKIQSTDPSLAHRHQTILPLFDLPSQKVHENPVQTVGREKVHTSLRAKLRSSIVARLAVPGSVSGLI